MEERLRQKQQKLLEEWQEKKPALEESIKRISAAYKKAEIEERKISAQFKAYQKLEKQRGPKQQWVSAKESLDTPLLPEAKMQEEQKEALKARLEKLEAELVLLKARQLSKQIDSMFPPTKHDNLRIPVEGANIRIGEVWIASIQGKINFSVVGGGHKLCHNKDGNPEFRCELRGPSDYVRAEGLEEIDSDDDDEIEQSEDRPTGGGASGMSVRDNASKIGKQMRGSVVQAGKKAGAAMRQGAKKAGHAALAPSRAVQHVMVKGAHSKYGAGLCIKVLLVDFELAGEPGTGIPNLKFDRIELELEVFARMTAVFNKADGQWVPGKDFKLKLVRFHGPSSLIVWAAKRILGIVKPLIKPLVAQALPAELGHLAAMQDGLEIDLEADFNITGNQNADDLVAELTSDEATSCLRFGSPARRVHQSLKCFHKLVKVLPPKLKLPPLKTVVQLIR
jgi:hypothetical protein